MTLSTSFNCSAICVPRRRCNSSATRASAGVRGLVPHALVRLLRPEDRLAISEGDMHAFPDSVRFFTRERENVGQEGFDALVHRVPRHAACQLSG